MKTFYSLSDFLGFGARGRKFAVSIGVFDGVHSAHQKVLKNLIKKAKKKRLTTLLITFDPHPANVLGAPKKVPLLISLKHRLRLLKEAGLDYALVMHFNKNLAKLSAAQFAENVLSKITIKEIVVGKNFFFGKGKEGTFADLKRFSKRYGYNINAIPALKSSGKTISSTRIRKLILKGKLKKASKLLSRPVTVLGTVVKGYKRGRIIGFPTANINPHHEAIPPSGVYAVKIKLNKKIHKGILNIGIRPTFKESIAYEPEPTIEVHIFNFDKSIYGKDLEISFVEKIRNERRFKSIISLRKQIVRDQAHAKQIFLAI